MNPPRREENEANLGCGRDDFDARAAFGASIDRDDHSSGGQLAARATDPFPGPATGVVLAGGTSSRFGGDKAQHRVDGRPMILRVLDAVRTVTPDVIVSVRHAGEGVEGVGFVVDRFPGEGPLAGLHAALLAATTEWVLVVPCDLPFIRRRDLQRLLDARTQLVEAVLAENAEGRLQPLCGCYHRSALARIQESLECGERSMRALVAGLKTTTVRISDNSLLNVNRPSDLSD